jgi:hypothetical protein
MFEVPDNTDVLFLGRLLLSISAVSLLWGCSSIATLLSAFAGFILGDSTRTVSTTTLEKWLVLSILCFAVSVMSWIFLIRGTLSAYDESSSQRYRMWFLGLLLQKIMGIGIIYRLHLDSRTQSTPEPVEFLEVRVSILEGRNLVGKDRNIWGRRTSSDPYVKVYHGRKKVGKTSIIKKTLDPKWDSDTETFTVKVLPRALGVHKTVECNIFDYDKLTADDSMGTCHVIIPTTLNEKVVNWYPVEKGEGINFCRNASGMLKVEVELRSNEDTALRSEVRSAGDSQKSFHGIRRTEIDAGS